MPAKRRKGAKKWYAVYAADVIPGEWIGDALASDPGDLIGRQVEVTLRDITNDFDHEKYKLWFRIYRVDDNRAYAKFAKEMLNYDYVRSLVQRRSSRIDVMTQGMTKDGHFVRIFNLIITSVRVRHSQERAIRKRVLEYVQNVIGELTLEELVRSALLGDPLDLNGEVKKIATKIAPIKNADVRKIVLLKAGEAEPEMERVIAKIEGVPVSGGEGEEAKAPDIPAS